MPEGELVGRRSSCQSREGEPKGAAPSIEQGPSGRLTERMCSLTYAGVAALRSEPRHPLASLVKNNLRSVTAVWKIAYTTLRIVQPSRLSPYAHPAGDLVPIHSHPDLR